MVFKRSEFRKFLELIGYDYTYVDIDIWLSELEADGYLTHVGTHFESAAKIPSVYPDYVYVVNDFQEFLSEFGDSEAYKNNRG